MSDFEDFSQSSGSSNSGSKDSKDDDQYRGIFVQELNETIQNLENGLIDLEADPINREKINGIFRLFHNLKGSSAMMEFHILKEVAHYAESLLNFGREGKILFRSDHIDSFLDALSAIKEIAQRIEDDGSEGEERYFGLLQRLVDFSKPDEGQPGAAEKKEEAPDEVQKAKKESDQIKVSRDVIEQMMLLVGEFMQLKNKIKWLRDRFRDRDYDDHCQELDHFSAKLQRNILKLRLSPIKPIIQSMRRVVRTTAQQTGKKIELDVGGEDTLLDRSILDILSDPLMHLVRNAIDHGIEEEEERIRSNKGQTGNVSIKASYKSGEVHIAVTDDGKGINADYLKEVCIRKGFMTKEETDNLSLQESLQLIFLPGFSGAKKVTETSGRGVGMDVVKAAINGVGGEIEIQTEVGVGTTFTMRLPLSLAIVECLGFKVGQQTYAIPQMNVEEVLSFTSSFVQENMKIVDTGAKILTVRDLPTPILPLSDIFDVSNTKSEALIQVRQGKSSFILEVGEILGPLSIVSQAVPKTFSGNTPFSGITTQGDGSLLFQLDVTLLAKYIDSKVSSSRKKESANRGIAGTSQENSLMTSSDIRRLQQKTIAFSNNLNFCIPVQRAKRVVFVTANQINEFGENGRSFITLEGQTIPIIWIEELVLNQKRIRQHTYSLLIFTYESSFYGIPMCTFHGIERMPDTYDTDINEPGILGTTVIKGQTFLCLDLASVVPLYIHGRVEKVDPVLLADAPKPRVLCAEDDKFFATELAATLRAAGYEVVMFEDGLLAKEALMNAEFAGSIDLCVTDIEMPRLTGLGLTRWMRAQDSTRDIPIVAYTAITTQEMRQKMMSAGAKAFVSKMSLEELVDITERILNGGSAQEGKDDGMKDASMAIDRTVTFRLGEDWYGLPMDYIKEVSPITISAEIPRAQAWINEVTAFRGSMIPVVDLRKYVGLPSDELPTEQAIVEVDSIVFAIKVGKIGEVLINDHLHTGEGIPKVSQNQIALAQFVQKICRYSDQNIFIVNPSAIAEVIQGIAEVKDEEFAA